MKGPLYLAWKYLRYHRGRTLVLILSVSLTIFIPLALNQLVRKGAELLTERAERTPLLVGAKGSETELCLGALYFRDPPQNQIPYTEIDTVLQMQNVEVLPLHFPFQVGDYRIVGTVNNYLDFRGLQLASGRSFALLGECVLGSTAASSLGISVGDQVISTPSGAFDIAGSFPLKMDVVGILKEQGTPDDEAVFTDIKTSWVIAGLAHGHEDVVNATSDSLLLEKNDTMAIASSAVLSYTEITDENRHSFHFHGDMHTFPLNAIIVIPGDRQTSAIIRGRYQSREDDVQMLVPQQVISGLVDTLFSIRNLLLLASILLGLATFTILALVFNLSRKLRARELITMQKIGGSKAVIRQLLGLEMLIILICSAIIAMVFTFVLQTVGLRALETFIT